MSLLADFRTQSGKRARYPAVRCATELLLCSLRSIEPTRRQTPTRWLTKLLANLPEAKPLFRVSPQFGPRRLGPPPPEKVCCWEAVYASPARSDVRLVEVAPWN